MVGRLEKTLWVLEDAACYRTEDEVAQDHKYEQDVHGY